MHYLSIIVTQIYTKIIDENKKTATNKIIKY